METERETPLTRRENQVEDLLLSSTKKRKRQDEAHEANEKSELSFDTCRSHPQDIEEGCLSLSLFLYIHRYISLS